MAKHTPQDWDEIRKKFRTSIMADTSLVSLAQNLDIKEWPLRDEEEKPSKYLEFTWDELLMLPEIAGSEARIDHLVDILKETLAFDDPFGDMVAQVEENAAKDNPVLRTLVRLGIPADYPLAIANLSEGTRVVCESEGLRTISEFATLGQQMAARVVLGGDFRHALNALLHGDEEVIAQYFPYRKGTAGLHLAEALGLVAARLTRPEQLALGKRYGAKLSAQTGVEPPVLTSEQAETLRAKLKPVAEQVLSWFADEKAELRRILSEGGTLERYFLVLNDPAREAIASHLTAPLLGAIKAARVEKSEKTPHKTVAPKKGFFARWFGRG